MRIAFDGIERQVFIHDDGDDWQVRKDGGVAKDQEAVEDGDVDEVEDDHEIKLDGSDD